MNDLQKEKVVYEYYGDGSSGKNALTKLVDKLLASYGGITSDHTDFYSIANETFVKCLDSYDESNGAKFETFLSNCISNKIKTQISYLNRDKRKNKDVNGNFIQDESLDRVINSESSGETTLGSLISDGKQNLEKIFMEDKGMIETYRNSLRTPTEKKILECWLNNLSHADTRTLLNIPEGEYNRIFAGMKKYERIKSLRAGNIGSQTHQADNRVKKENDIMMVAKTSSNAEKSTLDVLTILGLIQQMDELKILTNHPLQRESSQWSNEYKGNLITTILNNYKFNPLIVCEEYKNDMPYNWLIDGKQRATTIWEFRHNLFKVSKKSLHTLMTYEVLVRDENGEVFRDEDGRPQKELRQFDVANKKFNDLPDELKSIFDYYHVQIEKYLNCTEDEVQYHIIRYNDAKPMSPASKGTLRLGEQLAQSAKNVVNNATMFNEVVGMTGFAKSKSDALQRIVVESVMTCFYPDNLNKSHEKNCDFLAENGTTKDMEEFSMLINSMANIIDDVTGVLINPKNASVWFAAFNEFVGKMEENSNLTDKNFAGFMHEFMDKWFTREVDGVSFAILDEKGTKDKAVILGKIELISKLFDLYMGGDTTPIGGDDEGNDEKGIVEDEVIEETTPSEPVQEAVEVSEQPEEIPFEEEPAQTIEEPVTDQEEDIEPVFKYIDEFAEIEMVKRLGGTEREINRAAVVTAMMADGKNKFDSETIQNYARERDFTNYKTLIRMETEVLDKVNKWAVLLNKDNGLMNVTNLPVLASLGMIASKENYDDAKCKQWFEAFTLTYSAKGLEEGDYQEILDIASEDMKRSCGEKKPKLIF